MSELKKISSNFNGQTPSTGKEVEDAFNDNVDQISEKFESIDQSIQELSENIPGYSTEISLTSGIRYTIINGVKIEL